MAQTYVAGDRVRVINGAEKGLVGKIVSVKLIEANGHEACVYQVNLETTVGGKPAKRLAEFPPELLVKAK